MRILMGAAALALISAAGAAPAAAEVYSFDFINHSALDIVEIYMREAGTDDWGGNMIEGDPLVNGEVGSTETWDGVCAYDFAYVMSSGRTNYEYGVDLCEVDTLTVTDE